MATAEIDIEWIVREVVRRLRDLGVAKANDRTAQASIQPGNGSLEIEERLVTLDTLHNRLAGVTSVVVSPRAIVTPAVVDELKDRGVSLARTGTHCDAIQAATSQQHSATAQQPLVYVTVSGVDVEALQRLCGTSIRVNALNGSANWLDAISARSRQDIPAVLITDTPAAAVVTANRNANLRAAVGFNFPAVRQAVEEANANLLAIDPRGKNTTQLFGLINEFCERP